MIAQQAAAKIQSILTEASGPRLRVHRRSDLPPGRSHDLELWQTSIGRLVLKIPQPGVKASVMANAAAAQQLALAAGVGCPRVMAYRATPDPVGFPFLIETFVPGIALDHAFRRASSSQKAALASRLGKSLGNLHSIEAATFQKSVTGGRSWSSWNRFLEHRLDRELAHASATDLPSATLAAVQDAIGAAIELLPEGIRPRLVHRDLNPDNILVTEASLHLIDFEIAWYSDAIWDLARLYIMLLDEYPEARSAFEASYFETAEQRISAEPLLHLYRGFEYFWGLRRCIADREPEEAAIYQRSLRHWMRS